MSTFPIILIPEALENVKNERPSYPHFLDLPQAIEPGERPKKFNFALLGLGAVIVLPSIFLLLKINSILGLILLIVSGFAVTWQARLYKLGVKRYNQKMQKYRETLIINEQIKEKHEQQIKAFLTPEKIAKYRQERLHNLLDQTSPPDRENQEAARGAAEKGFQLYLEGYFPNNIYIEKALNIPNFDHPYTADFVYFDVNSNLHIDIEIDEPYVYKSKEPIHYLNSDKDERRNEFFLAKNWLVIRFAEEQVKNQPDSCCKIVAETISDLLGDNSILHHFSNIPPLNTIRRWTEAEMLNVVTKLYIQEYKVPLSGFLT